MKFFHSENAYEFSTVLYDTDGNALTPQSATLTVKSSDNTIVVDNQPCDITEQTINAQIDEVLAYDDYTLVWTALVDGVDVATHEHLSLVEYPYFEHVDLAAYRSGMSDVTPFSSFEELRDLVESRFESMCNCVFRQSPASVENAEYVEQFTADVKRACILLAADLLNDKRPNATREVDEMGTTTNFVIGGTFGNLTNIPEVNEIISRIGRKSVTVLC